MQTTTGKNPLLLTGAFSAVLIFLAVFITPDTGGPPVEDAQKAVDAYINDSSTFLAAGIIGLLGAVALIWFAGAIRSTIARSERASSPLPSIAFAGAIGGAISLVISRVIVVSQALRAEDATLDPAVVASFDDLAVHMFGVAMPVCASALVAGVAVASLRGADLVPRVVGWMSLLLAVAMIIPPIAWIANLVFLLWLVGVSVRLGTKAQPTVDAITTAPRTSVAA